SRRPEGRTAGPDLTEAQDRPERTRGGSARRRAGRTRAYRRTGAAVKTAPRAPARGTAELRLSGSLRPQGGTVSGDETLARAVRGHGQTAVRRRENLRHRETACMRRSWSGTAALARHDPAEPAPRAHGPDRTA